MGKYQPYPEYAGTGVEALETIPVRWTVKKANYLFSFGRGLNITKANLEDAGIPCVNYGEVHSKYGFEVDPRSHALKCVSEDYLNRSPRSLLSCGDFVFADTSEDIDGAGNFTQFIGEDPLFAGYHTVILRPRGGHDSRYLAYAFDSQESRNQIRKAVKGVKVFSITQEILKNTSLVLPSLEEQRTIATFLDYETARIDGLIEKQQRLIELLKEKRQAVISHAVTKGLNPDAPMKGSGVEWLGQVPEHWGVLAVNQATQKITNGYVGPTRDILAEAGTPYIQATHIKKGKVNFDGGYFVTNTWSQKHKKSVLKKGDVLVVQTGAGTGDTGLVSVDEEGYNCHALIILQPIQEKITGDYLSLVLRSVYGQSVLYSIRTGGMHPHLNCSQVKFVKLPVPSIEEQQAISKYVNDVINTYAVTKDLAQRQISLLQERRTALISAAVTGKIDLRNWKAPDAA